MLVSWKSRYEQQASAWRVLAEQRASTGNESSAKMALDIATIYDNLAQGAKA
jgi:hypothetical protein